jgi:hypothetical protein
MADNVTLPAQGIGTTQPIIESYDIGGGVQRQTVTQGRVTPAAGSTSIVTTAGTSVVAIAGPCNGGIITNPANETRQGVAAPPKVLYIDMVTAPGNSEANANGTTFALDPGMNWTVPPLASGSNVRVNSGTNNHKFSVVKW